MNANKTKVSVCLPTLNARKFLAPRMESVLAQTMPDWELIICDSYSDDGTWEYLQEYKDDHRVKMYQVPKEGIYAGWNECLKRVSGEYVYIATADDTCSQDCLEKMVSALENENCVSDEDGFIGQTDVAVCAWDFIDDNGDIIDPPRRTPDEYFGELLKQRHLRSGYLEFLVHAFLGTSWTTITSVLFRSSVLDKIGLFSTDCGAFADRFWGMKLALQSDFVYLPESLATWRYHSGQQSSVVSRQRNQQLNDLFESELLDLVEKLPREWGAASCISEFKVRMRNEYLATYELNRHAIKHAPFKFLKGLLAGFLEQPSYVLERLSQGFDWNEKYYADDISRLNDFVERMGVSEPKVLL